MNRKTKITLFGMLLITGGIGCFLIFFLGYFIYANRVPPPTAATTGRVIRYVQGSGTRTSKQSDSCTYAYRVEDETYTINSTCGANILFFADREGDKREIIYQTTNPSKAQVNHQGFLYFLGVLGFPLVLYGWFLTRKGMKMSDDEDHN